MDIDPIGLRWLLIVLRRPAVFFVGSAAVEMSAAAAKSSLDRGTTTRCFNR
jgi:hypothetical protein